MGRKEAEKNSEYMGKTRKYWKKGRKVEAVVFYLYVKVNESLHQCNVNWGIIVCQQWAKFGQRS